MVTSSNGRQKLAVIGNGMAAAKLLQELVLSSLDQYDITVFGNEPYAAYNRIMLSPLLAGEKQLNDIITLPRDWYTENNIDLYTGSEYHISKIERGRKRLTCSNGEIFQYDKLVIATGSHPFILPIPGIELEGVLSFRDIADVNKMLKATESYKRAVVIGAGLLGLEAAMGLMQRGMHVTVVHNNQVPLNRQLDEVAGKLLKHNLGDRGLHFKMNANSHHIEGSGNRVQRIVFDDDSFIETDLVVMAIGIRPNIELAQQSGLQCGRGILVSDTLQTYDPSIYALGECIEHRGETFGLIAPLYEQAKVLANHLSEHGVAHFQTLPTATKLKVTGISLFSMGQFIEQQHHEVQTYFDPQSQVYKKLVIQNEQLIGAVLYGDVSDGSFYSELIEQEHDISEFRDYIMFGQALCQQSMQENTPEEAVA